MSHKRKTARNKTNKRLRICLYARYSTEEQDETSIPDQFAFCRRELEALGINLSKAVIEEFSDPEMSGETVYRPQVDKVREGVYAKRWDIIACEDVSRWFRNLSACCELVETAFDEGMRVLAFNDDVDSDEDGWEDRFYEAARHHAKTNRYTSHRIKRKLEGLWLTQWRSVDFTAARNESRVRKQITLLMGARSCSSLSYSHPIFMSSRDFDFDMAIWDCDRVK